MSDIEKAKSQDLQPRPKAEIKKKPDESVKLLTYKIAFPTNDGQFINSHFGRSQYFLILEIEGQNVINKELRSNDSHKGMPDHHHEHSHEHHHEHHDDPEHQEQQARAHARIFDILHDVDILIAGGMGPRIYNQLVENGYTVIKTNISSINDALNAYLKGALKS